MFDSKPEFKRNDPVFLMAFLGIAVLSEISSYETFDSEVRIPVKLNSHSGQREHPDP